MFVTGFFGILNTANGVFEYCNGGHHPPFLLEQSGDIAAVENTGGMALGTVENVDYRSKEITIHPGDALFFYTDGLTEAMDVRDTEFSEVQLAAFLQENRHAALDSLINTAVEAVKAHAGEAPQSDDMTMMAVRYLSRFEKG